ncbi:hypothetical protein [Tumebacillus flagellatus]|uniref:Uncharacterized protein n=1 Tax=Tumebacillus flagellatus TaxID=1157490 RepID=A0A074LGZ0_9BACL|nr:hypothetical protein [Tumebacillus flagellatus]KEO81496.1 hypothetical protein EL26_20705 [Tumebacillus flagellatus]
MTDSDLVIQCKIGLNIPVANTVFDGTLFQKVLAVKSFMTGAGVSETMLSDPLAVGAIVLGVTDLWSLTGGEIKFSSAFNLMVTQLAVRS